MSHHVSQFIFLSTLWLAPSLHAQVNLIHSGQTAVLSEKESLKLATQCSRKGVPGIQSTWTPNASQVSEMEIELSKFLTAKYPSITKNIKKLYLQYAGFVVSDRHIIYINAFDEFQAHPPFDENPLDWRKVAMKMCDGGRAFWGLEYDLVSKTFSNMAFNGNA